MDTGPLQKPPSNAHDNDDNDDNVDDDSNDVDEDSNDVDEDSNDVDDDDNVDSCCARNKMSVVKKNKGIRLQYKTNWSLELQAPPAINISCEEPN